MMRTLTHEPLALAAALTLGIALFASALVALAAFLLHLTLRPARDASAAGAAGPGVPGLVAPGPDPIDLALDGPGTGDVALRELAFARDVSCWAADSRWPAPVVVPGRGEL